MKKVILYVLMVLNASVSSANTFVVSSLSDNGTGSLREAIDKANAMPDFDIIQFNISGNTGFQQIVLNEALPFILHPMMIDGYSHPGASETSGTKRMEIIGAGCSVNNGNFYIFQFIHKSSGSTVKGLILDGIPGGGCIAMVTDDNQVYGNFLGTDKHGGQSANVSNMDCAVVINKSTGNRIGGNTVGQRNIVSGVGNGPGVYVKGALGANSIEGNYIGLNRSGKKAISNLKGIYIANSEGVSVSDNVISGNSDYGIHAFESNDLDIRQNIIGLNHPGDVAVPNKKMGIFFDNTSGSYFFENYVSGNSGQGIYFQGICEVNTLYGNYIGFNAHGIVQTIGNGLNGIYLGNKCTDNVIGGENAYSQDGEIVALQSNFISGNGANGIYCQGSNNIIKGNTVGLGPFGKVVPFGWVAGNAEHGIVIAGLASNNVIGGYPPTKEGVPHSGNVIGGNGRSGIAFAGVAMTKTIPGTNGGSGITYVADMRKNLILGNRIGIDVDDIAAGNKESGIYSRYGYETRIWHNTVCDNGGSGIYIDHLEQFPYSDDLLNDIQKNLIGLDANNNPMGNSRDGVTLTGHQNLLAQNVICSNKGYGAAIVPLPSVNGGPLPSQSNIINGNRIGINPLEKPSGNQKGGVCISKGLFNVVGELALSYGGNLIAFNGGDGVLLENGSQRSMIRFNSIYRNQRAGVKIGPTAFDNTILTNSIYYNGALGIELVATSGVLAPDINDDLDPDKGGNDHQNYPTMKQVVVSQGGTNITVEGYLESEPETEYLIEVYYNPTAGPFIDPSGYGEGYRALFRFEVTTDGLGIAQFNEANTLAVPLAAMGHFVSTATRIFSSTLNGIPTSHFSTSEFSENVVPYEFSKSGDANNLAFQTSESGMICYPNPANDHVSVTISNDDLVGAIKLTVLDVFGRVAMQRSVWKEEGQELNTQLDVSELASGHYTMICDSKNRSEHIKFIKQ